jgi:hypothetical protein
LLAAKLWPGARAGDGKADPGEFFFLAVNDTHYLDRRCGPWLEGAVRQMKGHAEKPEFCLYAGDLTDQGKAEQLAAARNLFSALGVTTLPVIGNHGDLSQDDRKSSEESFPKRMNDLFEHRGWYFLGLDSTDGVRWEKTAVGPATLRYLEETLPKLDRRRPLVVFTHFPLAGAGQFVRAARVPVRVHSWRSIARSCSRCGLAGAGVGRTPAGTA